MNHLAIIGALIRRVPGEILITHSSFVDYWRRLEVVDCLRLPVTHATSMPEASQPWIVNFLSNMHAINEPYPEAGTAAGSHLKQERHALESKSGDTRDQVKQKAQQSYDDLRQGTLKVVRESGSYLKRVGAEQQRLLVEKLGEYRDALKAASDKLESDHDTVAAKNIRKASSSLERVADFLRDSEPGDLLSDAGRVARRRPELVFGGLFLAGLGLARMMKSSARERPRDNFSSNGGSSAGPGDIRSFGGPKPATLPIATPAGPPAAPGATFGGFKE